MSRDAAVGTITLQLMLFFLPSIDIVLHRPTRPSFAALEKINVIILEELYHIISLIVTSNLLVQSFHINQS